MLNHEAQNEMMFKILGYYGMKSGTLTTKVTQRLKK